MKVKALTTVVIMATFLVAATANAAAVHIGFDNGWTVDFDDTLLSTDGSTQIYADPNVESPHVDWNNYPFKDEDYTHLNRTEFRPTGSYALIHFAQAGKTADLPQWPNNLTGRQNSISIEWNDRPSYSGYDIYDFLMFAKDTSVDFYASVNSTGKILGTPFSDFRVHIIELSREDITPVPIPAAVWLFGSGLLGLIGFSKRKTAT